MLFKLTDPIKLLVKLLQILRRAIEKKLTSQTVNFLAILLVATITTLTAQTFVAMLILKLLVSIP